MSNWSDSTFQFVRRTPRPISATTPPSKDQRNPTRIDTPRPPPNFPVKRQLSIPPNASNAKKVQEDVCSSGPKADAKVNVTSFCAAREVQLKETERKLELMTQDNEKLKEELNHSRLQVTRLETFNQQLEKSCGQLEDRVGRCESYYRDIQADYDEACKALELAESIRNQMTSAFEDLKTVFIDDVRNQVKSEADAEIRRLNERLQEFEKTHNEAARDWQRRSDDWANREQSNLESLKQISNDRDLLKQQLSQTTAALSLLIQDKNQIQNKFEAALTELHQVKGSYQQELDMKIGNTVSELQTERSILATIRKKLAEKEEQTAHLINQAQQMENQLREFHQRVEMYEQQRTELSGQLEMRDTRIASLEHQEKQLLEERNRLLENITQKQQQLVVVTNQFEAASLACSEARDTAKDLTQDKASLQDELVSVSHQLEKYRDEENRLKTENDRLQQNLKSVTDDLTEQTKELSVAQSMAGEVNLKCDDLTSRLTDLETEHEKQVALTSKLEEENGQLKTQLAEQEQTEEQLRRELQIEKEALERADKEVVDLREALGEKDRALMEKAIELEYKNRRIDALTEANEKLEHEVAESLQDCSLDRSHTQLETSVRENQSRIQELVIKLDRQKEQEKKTVAKLKYELQLARESQERAEAKAAEAEATAAALRSQLEEAVKHGEANRQKLAELEKRCKPIDASPDATANLTQLPRPQFQDLETDEESPAPKKSVTFKDPNKELLAKFHQFEAKATDEMVKVSAKKGAASSSTTSSLSQTQDNLKRSKRRLQTEKTSAQSMVEASPVLKSGPSRNYGRTRSTTYPTGSKADHPKSASFADGDFK